MKVPAVEEVCGVCEGSGATHEQTMRRVSKWLPIYTAWEGDPSSMEILAIEDVDAGRLQCKAYVHDGLPGGLLRLPPSRVEKAAVASAVDLTAVYSSA